VASVTKAQSICRRKAQKLKKNLNAKRKVRETTLAARQRRKIEKALEL